MPSPRYSLFHSFLPPFVSDSSGPLVNGQAPGPHSRLTYWSTLGGTQESALGQLLQGIVVRVSTNAYLGLLGINPVCPEGTSKS